MIPWTLTTSSAMVVLFPCLGDHLQKPCISGSMNCEARAAVSASGSLVLDFIPLSLTWIHHRRIAWSRWGSIASIAPDGHGLELRSLQRCSTDGAWTLSEANTTPHLIPNFDGGPVKHLTWSPSGSDLALIDACGRVSILGIFSSLNKPAVIARYGQSDPAEDQLAVVGCAWLSPMPPKPIVGVQEACHDSIVDSCRSLSMAQPPRRMANMSMEHNSNLCWAHFIQILQNQPLSASPRVDFCECCGPKITTSGANRTPRLRALAPQMT